MNSGFVFLEAINNLEKIGDRLSNIAKAVLIEKYLINHKEKIELFSKKYFLEDDEEIKVKLERISSLIKYLEKIQVNKLENEKVELAILTILKEIKTINKELKDILIIKKQEFDDKLDEKKEYYWKLWKKLALELNKINVSLSNKGLKDKKILTLKESKLKNALIQLEKEEIKLNNFDKIKFNSENELKQAFLRTLLSIKKEMKIIRENIKD